MGNELGPVAALEPLLGLGFRGYWLDTYAFPDAGAQNIRLLNQKLGVKPIVSPDRRFYFWDLRPYRATINRTDTQLRELARDQLGV